MPTPEEIESAKAMLAESDKQNCEVAAQRLQSLLNDLESELNVKPVITGKIFGDRNELGIIFVKKI